MAVVMVIIGLVMMAVFPALNVLRVANQRTLTQSNLHNLMLATASYVQANGCLPCPASAAVSGAGFGALPYATPCGSCSAPEGIPPFVALGIPAATAHDGWGHWITMRVDPNLTYLPTNPANCGVGSATACSVFVPPTANCGTTDYANGFCLSSSGQDLTGASKGFCKPATATLGSTTAGIKVVTPNGPSQYAAVIFVSHGANGYGSCFAQASPSPNNNYRLPFPSNYTTCSASGGYDECNAGAGSALCNATSAVFYDAPTVVSLNDPYDDMLAYANRNMLVSMLGNGSCNTVW